MSLNNDFSRLRSLDLFFNFCLVIDETLKVLYKNRNGNIPIQLKISDGIIWFCCNLNSWIAKNDLTCYWSRFPGIELNDSAPDNVIPRLLVMNESWRGQRIRDEIYPFLIAYKFRNYGGHRISQQEVISQEYFEIIEHLMFALFLTISEL
jgi:hypothetical protein